MQVVYPRMNKIGKSGNGNLIDCEILSIASRHRAHLPSVDGKVGQEDAS